jgi:hypothetical protein
MTRGLMYAGTTLISGGITMPHLENALTTGASATNIVAGGTQHTVGTWVDLFAADTTREFHWINCYSASTSTTNTDTATLIELGVGTAGNQVVVATFAAGFVNSTSRPEPCINIPFKFASGSRIWARNRSAVLSKSIATHWWLGELDAKVGTPVEYGVDTSTSRGAAINNPADTTNWGTWTVLSSSTSKAFQAFHIGTQVTGGSCNASTGYVQIGYGADGAETVVAGIRTDTASTEYMTRRGSVLQGTTEIVPAGSRLVIRYKRDAASTSMNAVVHGIPIGGS